jgi:hypothetical protein
MARTSILALAVLCFIGAAVQAQQSDLERILERDRIALQKLQAEVNHAIAQSRVLERAEPSKAREFLEDAVAKVRAATDLPGEERARLLQLLQVRQRTVNAVVQARQAAAEDAARREANRLRNQPADAGDPAPGKAALPSQGPAGVASKVFETRTQQLQALQFRNERNQAATSVLNNLERSATPIRGEIELPKDWDRVKQRGQPKLSEREVALLRALNSTMSVNFDKTRFRDVIDYIQEKAGMTILVDEGSLRDAMVDYDDPVNFKIKQIGVRTLLKKILADRGLAYTIREGALHVVTQQKARETMTVRVYPIAELLGTENRFIWGPVWKRAFELQHAQTIVNMVQQSVDPSMWNVNGGPGSVTYHEPTQSLIIRASTEMHYMLSGNLLK